MSLRSISHFDVDSNVIDMLSLDLKPKEQKPNSSPRSRHLDEVNYWDQDDWNGYGDDNGYRDDYVSVQQVQTYQDDRYNDDANYHVIHGPKFFSKLRFGGVILGISIGVLLFLCPVRKKRIEEEEEEEDDESDASPPRRRSSSRSKSSSRNRSTSRKKSRGRKRIKDSASFSDDDYELMEEEGRKGRRKR